MTFDPSNPPRDFKGIWIPKEIWLDSSLSLFEKALFAEIHSLDGECGCFAENEYFEKFFGITSKTLQRGFRALKERGYIYDAASTGRGKIRKSNLKTIYDKFYPSEATKQTIKDKFYPSEATNLSPPPYIDNKRENIKEPHLRSVPKKRETVPKKRFEDAVLLTEEEHKKLINVLGESKSKEYIKRLDLYIGSKGRSYKSHYKTILMWVMKDEEQEKKEKLNAGPPSGVKAKIPQKLRKWKPKNEDS